ncbi:MAG: Bug family tripartite tricarboxylate transporter substrate binding protein [Burkholderiaceae bacterium]
MKNLDRARPGPTSRTRAAARRQALARCAGAVCGLLVTSAAATLAATPAAAQGSYPNRPINIVIGFAPGGITDIFARDLGQEASRVFNQPVVIDNKPGASGVIAAEIVARAAPDGYTLLMTANNHSITPALRASMRYDAISGFAPITMFALTPNILVVPSSSPHKDLADYVAAARKRPGAITFASSGIGTGPHLSGEYFGSVTGAGFVHVPYKGSNQSLMAAMSGEVDSTWSAAALQQIKAGKVRALGVASAERFSLAPDIPTFAEQGFKDFRSEVWVGLLGPANLPAEVTEKWNTVLQQLLSRKDVQDRIKAQGYEPVRNEGPAEFRQRLVREVANYKKIVSDARIQVE